METVTEWIINNYIEVFGAVTGIIYVFLEIRQNIWLWPVGVITSATYIWIFFTGKLYADMSLQGYYLTISVVGWYWWGRKRHGRMGEGEEEEREKRREGEGEREDEGMKSRRDEGTKGQYGSNQEIPSGLIGVETKRRKDEGTKRLKVTRLGLKTGILLATVSVVLYGSMWFVLDRFTDSPVPQWDSFITSLSVVATWMLARKIYEHWFLWIIVNTSAALLFFTRELYPTVILYSIYLIMSFAGLKEWSKSLVKGTSI